MNKVKIFSYLILFLILQLPRNKKIYNLSFPAYGKGVGCCKWTRSAAKGSDIAKPPKTSTTEAHAEYAYTDIAPCTLQHSKAGEAMMVINTHSAGIYRSFGLMAVVELSDS